MLHCILYNDNSGNNNNNRTKPTREGEVQTEAKNVCVQRFIMYEPKLEWNIMRGGGGCSS